MPGPVAGGRQRGCPHSTEEEAKPQGVAGPGRGQGQPSHAGPFKSQSCLRPSPTGSSSWGGRGGCPQPHSLSPHTGTHANTHVNPHVHTCTHTHVQKIRAFTEAGVLPGSHTGKSWCYLAGREGHCPAYDCPSVAGKSQESQMGRWSSRWAIQLPLEGEAQLPWGLRGC